MSIHFISGKPRGGKSLYGVKLVIEELAFGERCIITNLAFKLPELNEYLQRTYPKKAIDLHKRIIILEDNEIKAFFTRRPFPSQGPSVLSKEQWKNGVLPDYSKVSDGGVFYAIDEVHIAFNARAWMETGADVLFYLSQHAKLGDTVLCITQHIGNVDKQFRSVAQDFTYLRNLKKQKLGMFRMPGIFVRRTYPEPATPTSQCAESGTFSLDVSGIAACYETAKGVGIHGRNADKGEVAKGIPWYVPAVLIPLMLVLLYAKGPVWIAHFFSKGKAHAVEKSKTVVETIKDIREDKTKESLPSAPALSGAPLSGGVGVRDGNGQSNRLYVVLKTRHKGYWEVILSNGRRYSEGNGLEAVSQEGARVLGEWIDDHPPLVGESSFKGLQAPESPGEGVLRTKLYITPSGTNIPVMAL